MFGALKPGFRSLATLKLVVRMLSVNFKPKGTAAASRGFLAIARLSCFLSDIMIGCKLLTVPRANLTIGQRAFSYSSLSSGTPLHFPPETPRP